MIDEADALVAALDGGAAEPFSGDPRLLGLATELTLAFATWRLPDDHRAHLLGRALSLARPERSRRLRDRIQSPRMGRVSSAVVGGAAVVALAAIGITVVHHRRAHATVAA